MLTYNVLNDYVERLKKKDMPIVASTDNVTTLTTEDINNLRAGDIVLKEDVSGKHAYIVSYKKDGTGICLTYTDATYIETVSYDYNSTTHEWTYNSMDATEVQPKLTAGDNVSITNGVISATDTTYTAGDNITIEDGVISATDTTYTAGNNITINDGVISASGGDVWESLVRFGNSTDGYLMFHIYTKEEVTSANALSIISSEFNANKMLPCFIGYADNVYKNPRVTINNVLTIVEPISFYVSNVQNPVLTYREIDANGCITNNINTGSWNGWYSPNTSVIYSHKIN